MQLESFLPSLQAAFLVQEGEVTLPCSGEVVRALLHLS